MAPIKLKLKLNWPLQLIKFINSNLRNQATCRTCPVVEANKSARTILRKETASLETKEA